MTLSDAEQTRPIAVVRPPARAGNPEMIYAWGALVVLGLVIVVTMFVLVALWS